MFNIKKAAIGIAAFVVLATGTILAPVVANADGGAGDIPVSGFSYDIGDNGLAEGVFLEVSGLSIETYVIEYRDGAEDVVVRKRPGMTKYSNITLKKGYLSYP